MGCPHNGESIRLGTVGNGSVFFGRLMDRDENKGTGLFFI